MIEPSQIARMSVTERLQAMDQLWDSSIDAVTRYLHRIGIKTFWLTGKRESRAEKQSF
jgi:hypothetical protein